MTCTCGREKILITGAIWCPTCDGEAPLAAQAQTQYVPGHARWTTEDELEFIRGLGRYSRTPRKVLLQNILDSYQRRQWGTPGVLMDRATCERAIREELEGR